MDIFKSLKEYDYEQLIFCQDKDSGLKAIIAIHDTTLGPALGGTRILDYNSEEEAIIDALRLSRGMTYKNAAAGLNLGGGKTVILGDPKKIKNKELFKSLGRYIESLNGRYITAEDMNVTTSDMAFVKEETDYVVGLEGRSGDPSPITAFGIYRGILAGLAEVYGDENLTGRKVAVQGLGAVGYKLCRYLYEAGAQLIITDNKPASIEAGIKEFGATGVDKDDIYDVECDIFSPCAKGAILNDLTINRLKCKIIGGSANNQLAQERYGDMLREKDILYLPDYVINSGGVINVYQELEGYDKDKAMNKASEIYDSIKKIIEISKEEDIASYRAANRMVEERIKNNKRAGKIYLKDR